MAFLRERDHFPRTNPEKLLGPEESGPKTALEQYGEGRRIGIA